MRIEICAARGEPPSGDVVIDGGPVHHFDGWLALLGMLADALDPDSPPDVGGLGGELAPRGDTELGEGG